MPSFTDEQWGFLTDTTRAILESGREGVAHPINLAGLFLIAEGAKPCLVHWAADYGDHDGIQHMQECRDDMIPLLADDERLEVRLITLGEIPMEHWTPAKADPRTWGAD